MLSTILGHGLAVCIGLSLGLIGGGGSILAVPILVYVMGIRSKVAIAMSLVIVGSVSLIGVIPHWRQGHVNFKTALTFTPAAMIGAYLGASLTSLPFISDAIQLIAFGLVMIVASAFMILNSHSQKRSTPIAPLDHERIGSPSRQVGVGIVALGLVVGILTGFVGVGGGFLIIPALVLLGGLPMKEAIGTSLLIITTNSAAGFLGYLNQVTLNWGLIISFTAAASLGVIVGAEVARYIDANHLQKGFGYFVLSVAVFVLIRM